MPPPLIAAGVGAAASIGGAVLGGNSTKKAARQAADTSMQTASMNNALAKDIYGQNRSALAPFMTRGNAAGDQINAMLGLSAANTNAPAPAPAMSNALASPQGWRAGPSMQAGVPANWRPRYDGELHYSQEPQFRASLGLSPTIYDEAQMPGASYLPGVPAAAVTTQVPAANPMEGFRQYIANSDYGFRFGEGSNALNHGYAAGGSLQSGAAMKALEKYRQNVQAGYRGEYMNLLGQQQGVGLSGASALAGVGQNYAGSVMANNSQAGSDVANAALMRGAANAQMYSGIAGGIGNALGSSYMLWGR